MRIVTHGLITTSPYPPRPPNFCILPKVPTLPQRGCTFVHFCQRDNSLPYLPAIRLLPFDFRFCCIMIRLLLIFARYVMRQHFCGMILTTTARREAFVVRFSTLLCTLYGCWLFLLCVVRVFLE